MINVSCDLCGRTFSQTHKKGFKAETYQNAIFILENLLSNEKETFYFDICPECIHKIKNDFGVDRK